MLIAVRIDDGTPGIPGGVPRRARLYELLGNYQIYPYKIKTSNNMHFTIINKEHIEKILSVNCKQSLAQENFEIYIPLEYKAMKTVVAKQLDVIMDHYSDEEIITNIELSNDWCKVEEVYRLGALSEMLKIRFASTEMAIKALNNGILILNQSVPSRNIEKEIFVNIKPCYNCFQYSHATKNCPQEKKLGCSNCANEGHRYSDCPNKQQPECLNCGENHRTLAAKCSVRKQYIKEKSKEMRERSRSRSRARTFAETVGDSGQQYHAQQNEQPLINPQCTKEMTTIIMTAVITGHYVEMTKPGSFQKIFDKIMEANGLPRVIVPMDEIIKNISSQMEELISTIRNKNPDGNETASNITTMNTEQNMQTYPNPNAGDKVRKIWRYTN